MKTTMTNLVGIDKKPIIIDTNKHTETYRKAGKLAGKRFFKVFGKGSSI